MVAEMAHIFLANAQDIPAPADEQERADYLTILVTRARAGDALAFERIMLATEQRVVSIAWRMLGDRDDARLAVGLVLVAGVVTVEGQWATRRALHDLLVAQHPEQSRVLAVVGLGDGLVDDDDVERPVGLEMPQRPGGDGRHGQCQDGEEADGQGPTLAEPREHMDTSAHGLRR